MKSKWDKIEVGREEFFEIDVDQNLLDSFIAFSGDKNILHTDSTYAESRGFERKIVHGMLLASFFSKLVGEYFLEQENLYISQTLFFRKPLYVNSKVIICGKVQSKSISTRTMEIKTVIKNSKKEVFIDGVATVKSLL